MLNSTNSMMKSVLFTDIPGPDEKFVDSLRQKLFEKKVNSFKWFKYSLLCALIVAVAVFVLQPIQDVQKPIFDKVKALEQINVTLKKYYDPTKLNYSKVRTTMFDKNGNISTWNVNEGWGIVCGAKGGVGMITYPDTVEYTYDNGEWLVTYNTKKKEIRKEYMRPAENPDPDNENPYCYEIQGSIDWYTKNRYVTQDDEEPEVTLVTKDGIEVIKLSILYRNYEIMDQDVRVDRYYLNDTYIPYLTEYYEFKNSVYTLYKTERYEALDTLEPTNENLNSHLTMDLYWPKTMPKDVKIYKVVNSIQTGPVKTRINSIGIAKPTYNYNFVPLSPIPTIPEDTYNNR